MGAAPPTRTFFFKHLHVQPSALAMAAIEAHRARNSFRSLDDIVPGGTNYTASDVLAAMEDFLVDFDGSLGDGVYDTSAEDAFSTFINSQYTYIADGWTASSACPIGWSFAVDNNSESCLYLPALNAIAAAVNAYNSMPTPLSLPTTRRS